MLTYSTNLICYRIAGNGSRLISKAIFEGKQLVPDHHSSFFFFALVLIDSTSLLWIISKSYSLSIVKYRFSSRKNSSLNNDFLIEFVIRFFAIAGNKSVGRLFFPCYVKNKNCLSKHLWYSFFCENSEHLLAFEYFCKKAPS